MHLPTMQRYYCTRNDLVSLFYNPGKARLG
jgi:hypothetical protein